jgi:peptidoglycan/LPS O-acetylase OafA/YrhL
MIKLKSSPARPTPAGWLVGLDGLRAFAVVAVMIFHFAPDALPGGFLGVDLFFAISGYLITRLLLGRILSTGHLGLVAFYRRRWRRLMPAVAALLVVVTLAALIVWRDELPTLRAGVLASAGFVTNWWLVYDHQSYFVAVGRPPMIQHLWSLAIEEQFYLFWPVVVGALVGIRLGRRRRAAIGLTRAALARVAGVAVVLGAGSAVWMGTIATRDDVPYGTDSSRVYFGTDTHATGLLFGAALGALSLWRAVPPRTGARPRRELPAPVTALLVRLRSYVADAVAVGAFVLLVWQAHHVTEFDPALYRGGFAVIGVLGAVLVATVASGYGRLGRWLDVAPLRWIGQRSYGMYLWHWPVAVVTRPGVDITGPHWLLVGNQFVITLVLAEASYRFVEQPFRTGAVSRWLDGRIDRPTVRRPPPRRPASPVRRIAAWSLGAACIAAAVTVAQAPQHPANAESAPASAPTGVAHRTAIDTFGTAAPTSTAGTATAKPRPSPPGARTGAPRPTGVSTKPTPKPTAKPKPKIAPVPLVLQPVSAFGDSVMLGAAPALQAALPRIQISAVEGRQARSVFADITARRAAGTLSSVVVIHTGDNGIVSPDDLTQALQALSDRRLVVLLTARVPREWQGPNNATIKKIGARFKNVRILDWYGASNGQPSWFWNDGLHLDPTGATAYATLVRKVIAAG